MLKAILISERDVLLDYKGPILDLFVECFGHQMDESVWDWAYILNPNGNPIVSLCFDGEQLVGHYAVIPVGLSCYGEKVKALLSMTTMVRSSHRRFGLFVEQAKDVYNKAQQLGYQLVYGFPNRNSAPGFRKRLSWKVEDDLCVVRLNSSQLSELPLPCCDSIMFDIFDENNLNWRLSKPGQRYFYVGDSIVKKYGDHLDVVFRRGAISGSGECNVLLRSKLDGFQKDKLFDYAFGYRILDGAFEEAAFKLDLIMSDVF